MNYYKTGKGVVFSPAETQKGWIYSAEEGRYLPADMIDIQKLADEGLPVETTEKDFRTDVLTKLNCVRVWTQKARELAKEAHAGQLDKGGKDYFAGHLAPVANLASKLYGGGYYTIVAYLHDTLEDTAVTERQLREDFPPEVVDAVIAMTHRRGETYKEYISRVVGNEIARKVKICDISQNMDIRRIPDPTDKDRMRIKKYQDAFIQLMNSF